MKALQSNTSEDEVKRMMEELDIDLDGFISLEEFANFYKGRSDTVGAAGDNGNMAGLKDAFELYNQDKNGVISSLRSAGESEIYQNISVIDGCGV
ncbi:calcium-binding allergen Ole e 8-like [Camellia sinensis]|uniref:calcium-binding allergen Ole e 8-like n=1 Tax=Camellia sinensis TaxID=4442 RepID=UPI001036098A|nr:calcium-binding allergen Ole e 8-like [Camellia sinensis]